jgi:hypothetical protein
MEAGFSSKDAPHPVISPRGNPTALGLKQCLSGLALARNFHSYAILLNVRCVSFVVQSSSISRIRLLQADSGPPHQRRFESRSLEVAKN